jgi:hypothetical protein
VVLLGNQDQYRIGWFSTLEQLNQAMMKCAAFAATGRPGQKYRSPGFDNSFLFWS